MHSLRFSPPYYNDAEVDAVTECIRNGWSGTGQRVHEFERRFAEYKGVAHASAVSSCTSALFLALKALGIRDGDEVITTAMTFCSTVNVILHVGATPVLCDVDPISKNISPEDIDKKITSKTKAIIPVHYAGFPCDMDAIMSIASSHQIHVIEDCAHAIETKYKGKHVGSFGDVGCFSFYATKNIAIGEGGMVVSRHESLIHEISLLRLHGLSRDAWRRFESSTKKDYDVVRIGYKCNLTDIQAAIGLAQLNKLNFMSNHRQEIWKFYVDNLNGLPVELPVIDLDDKSSHSLHLFTIGLPSDCSRDDFLWRASKEAGLTFGVHYNSIPTFSAYKNYWGRDQIAKEFPVALDWGRRTVSLSLSAAVTKTDAERIVAYIKQIFG